MTPTQEPQASAALFGHLPLRHGVIHPATRRSRPTPPQRIPKILHHIWLGDAPLPDEYVSYLAGWREHHPDWTSRLWRDADLPRLSNQQSFDAATTHAQRSDLARLEILLEHGGVYVDSDMECFRNIESLIEDAPAFLSMRDSNYVTNCIMGSVPAHPFMQQLVSSIGASMQSHQGIWINEATGPGFITRTLDTFPHLAEQIALFHTDAFLPYLPHEVTPSAEDVRHAYGVHHYASSWLPKENRDYTHARWTSRRYRLCVVSDGSDPQTVSAIRTAFRRVVAPTAAVDLVLIQTDRSNTPTPRASGVSVGVGARVIEEPLETALLSSHDCSVTVSRILETEAHDLAGFLVRMAEIGRLSLQYERPIFSRYAGHLVEAEAPAELLRRMDALHGRGAHA